MVNGTFVFFTCLVSHSFDPLKTWSVYSWALSAEFEVTALQYCQMAAFLHAYGTNIST